MVEEARAYRERVLGELSRRRELARQQIEQLVHGRDRLLQAFERARLVAVDVVAEMTPVGEPDEYVDLSPTTGPVPIMVPARRASADASAIDESVLRARRATSTTARRNASASRRSTTIGGRGPPTILYDGADDDVGGSPSTSPRSSRGSTRGRRRGQSRSTTWSTTIDVADDDDDDDTTATSPTCSPACAPTDPRTPSPTTTGPIDRRRTPTPSADGDGRRARRGDAVPPARRRAGAAHRRPPAARSSGCSPTSRTRSSIGCASARAVADRRRARPDAERAGAPATSTPSTAELIAAAEAGAASGIGGHDRSTSARPGCSLEPSGPRWPSELVGAAAHSASPAAVADGDGDNDAITKRVAADLPRVEDPAHRRAARRRVPHVARAPAPSTPCPSGPR